MFFLIGGITPKIRKLEAEPKVCPRCGQISFYRVRLDHYLNLFFIPICSVKKGQAFSLCDNCRLEYPESAGSTSDHSGGSRFSTARVCPRCGRKLGAGFRFCPFCGQSLN